jgi:hypothetical protein
MEFLCTTWGLKFSWNWLKMTVYWDVVPWGPVGHCWHFGAVSASIFKAEEVSWLSFYPEDGGYTFLWNVDGNGSPDYMASHSRKQSSSILLVSQWSCVKGMYNLSSFKNLYFYSSSTTITMMMMMTIQSLYIYSELKENMRKNFNILPYTFSSPE